MNRSINLFGASSSQGKVANKDRSVEKSRSISSSPESKSRTLNLFKTVEEQQVPEKIPQAKCVKSVKQNRSGSLEQTESRSMMLFSDKEMLMEGVQAPLPKDTPQIQSRSLSSASRSTILFKTEETQPQTQESEEDQEEYDNDEQEPENQEDEYIEDETAVDYAEVEHHE